MEVFEKLKELRKQKGLSQVEMAKVLNITQSTYNRYEKGLVEMNYISLIKVADFFNISLDELFDRKI
ncbi:MAG: helix-turn-helix transcriptional regulator [Clostridiales bacterium]|nr:helix-turn-helix transcriptional regulator [Candidatus Apopatousia equi]